MSPRHRPRRCQLTLLGKDSGGPVIRAALDVQWRESQKLQAVGTLAGSVAHDVNNILGAVLGPVELALLDLDAHHPAAASLLQVQKAGLTTQPAGQATGLGLAVVPGIVQAQQGVTGVDSQPGQGSCFSLYLPARAPNDTLPASTPAAAPSPLLQASGQQVLYIDDDDSLSQLVHRLLTRLGLRVTCFQDARRALDALHAAPRGFDLVITDFNMPRLSGLDVAREVARLHPGLPVIISSGSLTDDLCTQAAQAGVRGLFNKEHSLEALGDEALRVLSR